MHEIFVKDEEFKLMRSTLHPNLTPLFGDAYKNYIKGDWATAEDLLA